MQDHSVGGLRAGRGARSVLAICLVSIVFEGYDLVAYGTALPSILADARWGLGPAHAGLIASYALVGMLVGSLLAGAIGDFVGRRWLVIASTAWFSAWMAVTALAGSLAVFGLARFMVGVGIGALIPTAAALAVEFAPPGRGNAHSAIVWAGYPGGGVLAALLGLLFLPEFGPRSLFWIGVLPIVTVVPLALRFLPESPSFLALRGRHEEAGRVARYYGVGLPAPAGEGIEAERRGPLALFDRGRRTATVLMGLMSAGGLLLTFGLNTWLPQLMRSSGYPLGSALSFLLVLNAGAILVPLFVARAADRIGPQKIVALSFAGAAVAISLMSLKLATVGLYVLTFVAGAGTIGAQVLVYGFAATYYPATCRAAGLAWTASVGRLGGITGPTVAGLLIAAGYGVASNFYVFAAVALVSAGCAACVPRRRADTRATGPVESPADTAL
jgi:MFS transporter, AAHS family, benzoate transport protein